MLSVLLNNHNQLACFIGTELGYSLSAFCLHCCISQFHFLNFLNTLILQKRLVPLLCRFVALSSQVSSMLSLFSLLFFTLFKLLPTFITSLLHLPMFPLSLLLNLVVLCDSLSLKSFKNFLPPSPL